MVTFKEAIKIGGEIKRTFSIQIVEHKLNQITHINQVFDVLDSSN